jgi:hypothetical protein
LNQQVQQLDDQLQQQRFTGAITIYYNQGGFRGAKLIREEVIDVKVFAVGLVPRSTE